MVMTWQMRAIAVHDIEKLTRAELLEAIHHAHSKLRNERQQISATKLGNNDILIDVERNYALVAARQVASTINERNNYAANDGAEYLEVTKSVRSFCKSRVTCSRRAANEE